MKYTAEQLEFLRLGYLDMRIPELTEAFNAAFGTEKTRVAIHSALTNNGFTCGRPGGSPKGTLRLFTSHQAAFIRAGYREHDLVTLTAELNRQFDSNFTVNQVRSVIHNQGMKSGRTGRFYAGQSRIPGSGARGPNVTSFKKGNMSGTAQRNYVPIGTTRITRDGYLERKVTDDHPVPARRWVAEHRLVWEATNGPIPEGHVVVFLDGDKKNIEPENLRCVPRGVLQYMNKNRLNETSGEARKAAILTAELVTIANQRARA